MNFTTYFYASEVVNKKISYALFEKNRKRDRNWHASPIHMKYTGKIVIIVISLSTHDCQNYTLVSSHWHTRVQWKTFSSFRYTSVSFDLTYVSEVIEVPSLVSEGHRSD